MLRKEAGTRQNNRAVGYVRRSTDRQEQSIPDQKKAIETYAAEHDLSLVKFYIDDAISGTSTLGRRAFQQMVQDAQKSTKRFDKIIVYDVKRFGRIDNDEAGYYRHILRTHGVEVIYVTENFNGDTTDDLLRPVKQWQARQESKDLSKVTIRGLLSKVEGGWWMGGTPCACQAAVGPPCSDGIRVESSLKRRACGTGVVGGRLAFTCSAGRKSKNRRPEMIHG